MSGIDTNNTAIRAMAGIVTFNPDLVRLGENIDSIRRQVDCVFVYDNASENTSGIEALCKVSDCALELGSSNAGLGAALNSVMTYALREGFSHVYLLDQDSVSHDGVIVALSRHCAPDVAIVSPLVVDRNKTARVVTHCNDVKLVERPITSGSLTSVDAWFAVNGFDASFFIDFIDYEFDERCLRAGYRLLQDSSAMLLQEGGHAEESKLISGLVRLPSGLFKIKHPYRYNYAPERLRVRYRNGIVFVRRYADDRSFERRERLRLVRSAVHDVFVERRKLANIRAIVSGIYEGFQVDVRERVGLNVR